MHPIDYARVVKVIGNEGHDECGARRRATLGDDHGRSVTGSTTSGEPLSEVELKRRSRRVIERWS